MGENAPARKAFDPTKKEAYDFVFAFLKEMEQMFLSPNYNGRKNLYAGLNSQGSGQKAVQDAKQIGAAAVDSSLVLHLKTCQIKIGA